MKLLLENLPMMQDEETCEIIIWFNLISSILEFVYINQIQLLMGMYVI